MLPIGLPDVLAEQQGDEASRSYEHIRAEFFSLRNSDHRLEKIDERRALAQKFISFQKQFPKHEQAPLALLNAAILHEEAAQYDPKGGDLFQAYVLLADIDRFYADSSYGDDALLRKAEFVERHQPLSKENERVYEDIIARYPDSDSAKEAKRRLGGKPGSLEQAPVPSPTEEGAPASGRIAIIVLDPGHGGEDYGAKGKHGHFEKDSALDLAKQLRAQLERNPRVRVRLTRDDDRFVPLFERTQFANDFDADVFVSLHHNASLQGQHRGFQVYVLDTSGDEASKKLAERENSVVRFEGQEADLQYMLSDMIQHAKLPDSLLLAGQVSGSVRERVSPLGAPRQGAGILRAPFYVLVGAHMPCVLVEMYYMDNEKDAVLLQSKDFRQGLVDGLEGGILGFLQTKGLLP